MSFCPPFSAEPGLTEEQKKNYLASLGGRCPYCRSRKVMTTSPPEMDGSDVSLVTTTASCDACGSSWRDVYKLAAVEEIERGNQFNPAKG